VPAQPPAFARPPTSAATRPIFMHLGAYKRSRSHPAPDRSIASTHRSPAAASLLLPARSRTHRPRSRRPALSQARRSPSNQLLIASHRTHTATKSPPHGVDCSNARYTRDPIGTCSISMHRIDLSIGADYAS
jgi:hypothetical protein